MVWANPAIVIGGEHNALGVIRNLGRQEVNTYCLTSSENDFAIYSRYCQGHYIAPNVESDRTVMQKTLTALAGRFSEKVYLHPTSDLAVLNLTQIIDSLPNCVASIPDPIAAETLIRKKLFYKSLQSAQIPHPVTVFSDEAKTEVLSQHLPFPVFIKPSLSQLFFQQFQKKGFIAHDTTELRKYLRISEERQIDVMVQEIIFGPDTNHYGVIGYMDRSSNPLVLFAIQILRQPSFFSVCSALKSISPTRIESLIQTTVNYLQALKYHGLFGCEWKLDPKDGVFKLLEVNARSCWFNTHQSACGVNHILMAYREAIGEPVHPVTTYEADVYGLFLLTDFFAITEKIFRGHLSYREVLKSYFRKKDWLLFAWDDPLPMIQGLRSL